MKLSTYLICFVIIFVGGLAAIDIWRNLTSASYIRGSFGIDNKFVMDSFKYESDSLVLYPDYYSGNDTYNFLIDLEKTKDFDGQRKKYEVRLNDWVLFNAKTTLGAVYSDFTIEFYNTGGDIICSAKMEINISFLSDATALSIVVVGEQEKAFVERYFSSGIKLTVKELKGV